MAKVKIGTYIAWLNQNGVHCTFGTARTAKGATFERFLLEKDGLQFVLTGLNQFEQMHPHTVMSCDRVFSLTSPWGEAY